MKYINSISPISKIYDSKGSKPVLIECDDLEHYVCKYNTVNGSTANKLYSEYIGACFLKYWELPVPDFAFVNILEEHITDNDVIQPAFFRTICFGSKFSRNYKEADKFLSSINGRQKSLFPHKYNFLKIALFDIWISNEDRRHDNYNLMLDVENDNNFIPIDHETIFNTGLLSSGLEYISPDESIIDTPFANALYTRKELVNKNIIDLIQKEYYICIEKCITNIDTILNEVPNDWLVNIENEKELLKAELFKKEWIDGAFNEFKQFLQLSIK